MIRTASSAVIRSWRLRRALLQTSALVGCALAAPQAWAQNLPDPKSIDDRFTFDTNKLTVDLKGTNQIIEYNSFNVAANNTVQFNAGGSGPLSVVNRVTNTVATPSLINGTIRSDDNVRVWLINRDGITFGAGGSFSGGSLVLSTLDLPADFGVKKDGWEVRPTQFSGTSTAGIVLTGGDNSGSITATSGSIVLVAQQIDVGKEMKADKGSVALVAASDVTFSSGIDSPLLFTVGVGTTLDAARVNVSGAISGNAIRIEGNAQVPVTAALLNVAANGSLTATKTGDGVILKANAGVVVAGDVASAGNYAIDASSVTLGEAGKPHQQAAGGSIEVTARSGALETVGGLLLQASGVGSTGAAVKLTASTGDVDLGVDTSIQTGAFVPGETNAPTGLAGVTIDAANAATIAGSVNVDGAYGVTAKQVTLGTALTAIEQRASGSVSISGTDGVDGLGTLHLQADSGGTGTAALTLKTSKALTFDGASLVEVGTDGARSDVLLAFAGASKLGTVRAGSLRSAEKTNLQLDAALELGSVTVSKRLDIDAGTHAIHADAINATGGLKLVADTGEVEIGAMKIAAGDIAIATNGTVSVLGTVDAAGAYGISAEDVVLGTNGATVQQVAAGGVSINATGDISGLGVLTLQARGTSSDTLALSANGAINFAPTTKLTGGGSITLESRGAGVIVGSAEAAASLSIDAGTSIRIGSATAMAGDVRLTASGGDITGLANGGASTGGRLLAGYDRVDLTASGDGATISVKAASGTAYLGSITAGRADGIQAGGLVEVDAGAVDLLQAVAVQGSVNLTARAGSVVAGRLEGDSVGVTASKEARLYDAVLARTGSYAVTAETITLGGTGSILQTAAGDVTLHATATSLGPNDTALAGLGALTLRSNTNGLGGELQLKAGRGAIVFDAASTIEAGTAISRSLLSVSAPSSLTLGTVKARALRSAADPVQLVVGGDVTLGSVTVRDTLDVATGGGSIDAGDLTSLEGDVALTSAPGGITLGTAMGATGVRLHAATDLRLGEADALAGDVSLDAGGDLTGRAGTAVAGDTLPLSGYGRAVIRATGDGGLVTITAGGTAQLGTITAGVFGGNHLAGTQIDLSAGAIDLHDASALQGNLVLTAGAGGVVAGPLLGDAVSVDATGGATLYDGVTATRGNYSVSAETVTLGSGSGIVQQAAGAVAIRARALSLAAGTTQTTLLGLGSLTLASGSAMTLRADRGGIDLGTASVVTVGAADSRAALSIGSGAGVTLGKVTARSMGGLDGATALVVPGNVVLGTVALDQALDLATTSGSVTADKITIADAGASLAIGAGGAGSIAITGQLGTNDGDILLRAAGNVTAPALTVLPGTTTNAGSIVVLAGGGVDLGTVSADEDISIRAGAGAVLGDLSARDDIDLYSTGVMALTSVGSTGDGYQGRDFQLPDPALAGTSAAIVPGAATTPASSDIRITAASIGGTGLTGSTDTGLVLGQLQASGATLTADLADMRIGTATVQGSLGATAGGSLSGLRTGWSNYAGGGPVIATTGAVTLDLIAPGGSITIGTLTAGTAATTGSATAGTLRIGQITADTVTMAAQNGLQIDTTTATGAVSLHLLGAPAENREAGSAAFDGAMLTAGISVSVTAGSTAFVDTVQAGNDIALTAGGALTVNSAAAQGLTTGDARITLAAATVNAGTLFNQGRGDILVSAAGDAVVTDATAAQGTLALLAGGSISSTGTLTAAEDIAVAAAGNAQFGTLRAGDDIDLGIGGTVTLVDAATSGLGSDTRSVTFDAAGAGLLNGIGFAGETAALGGSTLRIRAAALGGPTLTGSAADGLEVGGLQAGTATLRADSGDIRVRDVRSAGPAQATATLGSVTGLSDGWTALAGGARLASAGKLVFGVGGAIEAGSVTAAGGVATEAAAGSIRIASVTAGALDLTAAGALRIDSAAITGAAALHTTGGSAGPVNPPGGALVAGYGRGVFTAVADTATLQISGASAVQTGLLTAGTGLQVRGGAVDVGAVNVRFGTAQLSATTGRLALGTSGSGGSTGGGSSGPLAVPSGGASSSDLTIEADGDVNLGAIGSTTGRIFITSREGNVTGLGTISAASAGGTVQISAAGAIRVAGIQAGLQGGSATGDQISVTGQSIDLGAADARSGAISLRASQGGLTLGATTASGSATLVKRGAGTLALTGALTAGGDVLLDSQGDVEIGGAIGATGSGSRITVRNAGTGGTAIGDTRGDASLQLTQAEMGRLTAGTVIIDSGAQAVTIGDLAIAAGTGSGTLAFTTTGAVRLTGALTGATGGVVQIGGSGIDAPAAVADPAKLATTLSADVAGGARIALDKAVLDLRAQRIVFGNSALVGRYLPSGGTAAEPAAVARDVENSGSDLYRANASNSVFLSARSMRVSYTDFALFQNTGGANSTGVTLNDQAGPNSDALALQLFSTGDAAQNVFAMFGRVNGFADRAAGLLPNSNVEISAGGVVRVTRASSRLNGCVIGSPERGCLQTDVAVPDFALRAQVQTALVAQAQDNSLFFNPLVGRGNEGLIVDIVEAPVNLDRIDCPAGGADTAAPCAGEASPK